MDPVAERYLFLERLDQQVAIAGIVTGLVLCVLWYIFYRACPLPPGVNWTTRKEIEKKVLGRWRYVSWTTNYAADLLLAMLIFYGLWRVFYSWKGYYY